MLQAIRIGDTAGSATLLGPLIDEIAVRNFEARIAARSRGR